MILSDETSAPAMKSWQCIREVVMFSCVAICNLEGLALDFIGLVLKRIKQKGPTAKRLKKVVTLASDHGEFPYDWGAGSYVYLTFLSSIFIGSIIMEVWSKCSFYWIWKHVCF